MLSVLSISVQMGFAPDSTIASTVATKVKDCVITSSFDVIPQHASATLNAAVPEVTASENFVLNFFVNLFSKLLTL